MFQDGDIVRFGRILTTVQLNDELSRALLHPNVTRVDVLHTLEYGSTGLEGYPAVVLTGSYFFRKYLVFHEKRWPQVNSGESRVGRVGCAQNETIVYSFYVQIRPDFGQELEEFG